MAKTRGGLGVAGDVYPDEENVHPVDPDGDPAGLAPDDTRDTEADPTPNTMEAAKRNRAAGILDEFVIADAPPTRRGGRQGVDAKTQRAIDFLRAHPGQSVIVGQYSNKGAIPEALRSIDGNRVRGAWAAVEDENGDAVSPPRFNLHLTLTDQPYERRTRAKKSSTDPASAMVSEDATPADQSNEAKEG